MVSGLQLIHNGGIIPANLHRKHEFLQRPGLTLERSESPEKSHVGSRPAIVLQLFDNFPRQALVLQLFDNFLQLLHASFQPFHAI